MRVLHSFFLIVTAVLLWMLPIADAIYEFRTNIQEDIFTSDTAVGQTTENVTLSHVLYDNDTQTIDLLSSLSTDSPTYASYNGTTRQMGLSGLTDNTTRTLTVSYDVTALTGGEAINTVVDVFPLIWLFCVAIFPVVAILGLFFGRVP